MSPNSQWFQTCRSSNLKARKKVHLGKESFTLGNFHKRPQKNKLFLISIYLMLFRYIRMEKSKNWIYDDVLLKKSNLSKMASVKTNKNRNWTPLLKTNFSWLETLSLGPKKFLYAKGPKNAICLQLRLKMLNNADSTLFDFSQSQNTNCKLWTFGVKESFRAQEQSFQS